jgi:hypothetical protein
MKRVVVYHETVPDILQARLQLQLQHQDSTLVICSTKKQFLEQMIPFLSDHHPDHTAASEGRADAEEKHESERPHSFLDPTLQLISRSKTIKLAFCPTIDTLRAYLSTFNVTATDQAKAKSSPRAWLLIVDLILLHHGTSEFSVQGLMRSLASAVESAARNHVDLQLCECRDIHDLQNPDRGPRLWDVQVPLLSGSVRLSGEDAGWAERMVAVRTIAGRWLEFDNRERARVREVSEDADMLLDG